MHPEPLRLLLCSSGPVFWYLVLDDLGVLRAFPRTRFPRFGRSQSVSKYQVSKVWESSERRRCFASAGHMPEMTTSTISPAVLQTRAMAVERLRPGS